MPLSRILGNLLAGIVACAAPCAFAQEIAIQQPAIETFTVGTTVSVPDRGRMTIGGLGQGASSLTTNGPLRTGTSYGRMTGGTSVSVQAWVHDFDELDRQALDSANRRARRRDEVRLSPHAELAYRRLIDEDREPPEGVRHAAAASPERHSNSTPSGPAADDYLARGLKADSAGRRGVALVYLRLARDQGSRQALRELQRLDAQTVAATPAPESPRSLSAPRRPR